MQNAKPAMRGLLAGQLKRDFGVATAISLVAAAGWFVFVKRARMKKYEDFYKCYDSQADFIRMRELGVFKSVKPGGEVGEGW